MRIEHIAIWCDDIERMRAFYTTYFKCVSNQKYHNIAKGYSSYFLTFEDGDCRMELMNRLDIVEEPSVRGFVKGVAHFDLEVGDQAAVDALVAQLHADSYTIASAPRRTGDGYYEAAVADPEGNYIEISAKY